MTVNEVSVLLATYNGARFLDEQLQSIEAQQIERVHLWASDDGSTDATLEVLDAWRKRWVKGRFYILEGPRKGYVENFRYLVSKSAAEGSYIAFSDQDDVWDADKLLAATSVLQSANSGPALYCGRTRLVSSDGTAIGFSPLFKRNPSFRNALVQSIAGGNTMVLNPSAASLLARTCRLTSFVSHDWWCYQIVSGAGGYVFYDPSPRLSYRQHGANLIGENQGWKARIRRIAALADGHFATWNDRNMQALQICRCELTGDNSKVLDEFKSARAKGGSRAVYCLWKHGIKRQTLVSDVALYVAAALGKL